MVPPAGLEPARPHGQQILSLSRLPVPPQGPQIEPDNRQERSPVNINHRHNPNESYPRQSIHKFDGQIAAPGVLPSPMLRNLYDWLMRLAGHRHAQWYLAVVSFVESSVFPIPPDAPITATFASALKDFKKFTVKNCDGTSRCHRSQGRSIRQNDRVDNVNNAVACSDICCNNGRIINAHFSVHYRD